MSEKEFLKEKDLLLNSIEKNTVDHWENYYSNVPIKCIFEDIVIDINEIKKLTNQHQELKKQLEALKSTNKVLSEQLTKDKILKQDCLTTCCGIPIGDIPKLINQQKEFISYLENEKNRLIHEVSHYYTDSFDRQHVVNEDVYDEVDKILNKFKEIIGNDINVGSKGVKDER